MLGFYKVSRGRCESRVLIFTFGYGGILLHGSNYHSVNKSLLAYPGGVI